MGHSRVVLGLDIGVGSVGWGLVQLAEEKYADEKSDGTVREQFKISDGRIIAAGVRTFQLPQDRQKKSLASIRGAARRSRKTIRRKAQRMRRLIALAKEFHLIGDDFAHEQHLKPMKGDKESTWDIWLIRKEALERKLTDIEFFRVLYHIAKHRGFFFHTKAEETQEEKANSEQGKAKAGLARIRQKLEEGNWQSVGQMFWEEFKQTNPENKRKRNARDKYEHSIHRTLLCDEITKIFSCQRSEFKNEKATEVLEDRYINEVLMYEEGPDDKRLEKMMGRCELTKALCAREGQTCQPECTRCLCAPKESYSAERFSLFNRLNVLELVDIKSGAKVEIDGHQEQIEALAYRNAKVTFAQIRTALGLEDKLNLRFNLCSYREKNPEYNKKLECEIKNGRLQFGEQHKVPVVNIRTGAIEILDDKIKEVFCGKKLWPNAKKLHVYYSDIRKQLNLSGDHRFKNLSGYTKSYEPEPFKFKVSCF